MKTDILWLIILTVKKLKIRGTSSTCDKDLKSVCVSRQDRSEAFRDDRWQQLGQSEISPGLLHTTSLLLQKTTWHEWMWVCETDRENEQNVIWTHKSQSRRRSSSPAEFWLFNQTPNEKHPISLWAPKMLCHWYLTVRLCGSKAAVEGRGCPVGGLQAGLNLTLYWQQLPCQMLMFVTAQRLNRYGSSV